MVGHSTCGASRHGARHAGVAGGSAVVDAERGDVIDPHSDGHDRQTAVDQQREPVVVPDEPSDLEGPAARGEPAQDAHVLLYPEGMVRLNQSAGEILKRLDGRQTLAQVVADCESAFQAQGLTQDVLDFVGAALQQGWVRRV